MGHGAEASMEFRISGWNGSGGAGIGARVWGARPARFVLLGLDPRTHALTRWPEAAVAVLDRGA